VPLRIIQQPVELIEVNEGDTLEMICEAVGFPYPIYCWFQGNKQLSFSNGGKLVKTNVR
jgi:Immunoglobulin I-set domain